MFKWLYQNKTFRQTLVKRRLTNRRFSRGLKRATKILRKIFEHKRIRQVLGVNLLSVMVLLSQISAPASAFQFYPQPEIMALSQTEVDPEAIETETKTGFQTPLGSFRISQGFHLFHLGVDLAAPLGTPIKPIAQGIVERVEYGRWGFGNSVLLDHGSGLKSFYAHLGRIGVKQGDEVSIGSSLGTVGLSGRTTGPHLHLEIWENDKPLNPRVVLDLKPTSDLAKAQQ